MNNNFGRCGDDYLVSPDAKRAFEQNGYVTLTKVLKEEELQEIEKEFNHFITGNVPGMGRDFCDMSGPYDRKFQDFALVNAMLPRKYKPELANNIYEKLSESISRQLIGEDATLDYDQFLASLRSPVR